jgi:hypothetical protein
MSAPDATDSTAKDEFAAIQSNVKSTHSQKKCSDFRNPKPELSSFTVVSAMLRRPLNANLGPVKNQSAGRRIQSLNRMRHRGLTLARNR